MKIFQDESHSENVRDTLKESESKDKLYGISEYGCFKIMNMSKKSKLEFSKGVYNAKFPGIRGNEGEYWQRRKKLPNKPQPNFDIVVEE